MPTITRTSAPAIRLATMLTLMALVSGCGVLRAPLPVRDDDSPALAVRAAVYPEAWARGERSRPGIEVGYEGYRARETRILGAAEVIGVNGQDITGPDSVRQEATLRLAYVAYTHRFRFGESFELEPFAGMSRVSSRFTLEPAASGLRPSLRESRNTPMGGVAARWYFTEQWGVEARVVGLALFEARATDVALVLRPVPNLALRLGYSEREHVQEDGFGTSRVEVRARGPSAVLSLEF